MAVAIAQRHVTTAITAMVTDARRIACKKPVGFVRGLISAPALGSAVMVWSKKAKGAMTAGSKMATAVTQVVRWNRAGTAPGRFSATVMQRAAVMHSPGGKKAVMMAIPAVEMVAMQAATWKQAGNAAG